jgi:ABC-2 type transport system ATP-binding protein
VSSESACTQRSKNKRSDNDAGSNRISRCKQALPVFGLDDVSFELEQGQIMGFVGPNGAGKSTTIRILIGLVQPDSGEVHVLGHSMPNEQAAAKRDIGFVSDDMNLFGNATLSWHMAFVKSLYPS